MGCPVCNGEQLPQDVSVIDQEGRRVLLRGKVYAIIPAGYTYSPYKDYYTVSLYVRRGKVKYLKFKTQQDLDRWLFEANRYYIVEGCLHGAGGKELIFDINRVENVQ